MQNKKLASFLRKRAAIEEEYAKKLQKLVQTTQKTSEKYTDVRGLAAARG